MVAPQFVTIFVNAIKLSFLDGLGGYVGTAIMPILRQVRKEIMNSNPGGYTSITLLHVSINYFV